MQLMYIEKCGGVIYYQMGRLRKFMGLSWSEKLLHIKVALCLVSVKIGLYLFSFERLRRWMTDVGEHRDKPINIGEAWLITRAIGRIGRALAPLRINCLPQALVGYRMLSYRGMDVRLKIGVVKSHNQQLAAHAWLEYENRVILGDLPDLGQFTAFPSLESARR